MYSKKQSVEMLKEDPRVAKVENTSNKLIIYTTPIKLKPDEPNIKKMIFCPIGKYKIVIIQSKITATSKKLYFDVKRVNGPVSCSTANDKRWHTHHINEHICWGTATDDIETIKKNNDWFWLTKMILELISANNPEGGQRDIYYRVVPFLQMKYAIDVKNKKWQKKLKALIKKKHKITRVERWL